MSRKNQPPEPPEDKRLQTVLYCMKEGLRKLVPCPQHYGAPPYTKYGMTNSEWNEEGYDEQAQNHLIVAIWAWYAPTERQWVCRVMVQDGDDFMFERYCPLTWENWCRQMDLYNQITYFDEDIYVLLQAEGFA